MPSLEDIISVFQSSPNAYLVVFPDVPKYTIAAVNNSFLKLTNFNQSEIVGISICDVFPKNPNDEGSKRLMAFKASLEHALYLKKSHKLLLQQYDLPLKGTNEFELKFWNCDTYPVMDENNEVKFIVLNPLDVTNSITSKVNKHNLIDYTSSYSLFNNFPDAVFSLDIKGNFLSVNKAFIDLIECSEEELLRMSFISFLHPNDFEKTFSVFQKATEGEIQNFEVNLISAKGNPRFLSISNLPIVVNQEIIGIHAVGKDIEEFKKTERKLEEYHNRIQTILESITDAFFAVDRNSIVTYWNREAERILHMSRKMIIGKNLWEVFKEALTLKFYTEYQKAVSENVSVRFDEYYPPLKIWVEVSAFPSSDGISVYFKDISDRKKAEEELKFEKEKYKDLFNLSPLPQFVYDLQTLSFLDVNEAAIKYYGYPKREFLTKTIRDIHPPEEIPVLEQIINNNVRVGHINQSLMKHLKRNGDIVNIKVTGTSTTYGGKNARLVVTVDETEKIEVAKALEISEKRFKALVQDGSDLVSILDKSGNYRYVSPTSKSVLGMKASELVGRNLFDFIHQEDKELVADKFMLLSDRHRVKIPPFRFNGSNKQFRWIETIITDMTDDPAISGIIANCRDVTQRIENEVKTKQSIERFNAVSRATSDAIWDWDFLSGVVIWNKGVEGIFGHNHILYSQQWWYSQVHPEDVGRVTSNFKSFIDSKESRIESEYRFRCSDGSYKHVLDRAFLIFNKDGDAVRMIGSMQDISERINYIRSIEEQNKKLLDIAWIQSHVVRAPLARMMGISKLIYDKNTDDSLRKELLDHLDTSASELDDIIKDIVRKTNEI